MKLGDLIGKTVKEILRDTETRNLILVFTDGSKLGLLCTLDIEALNIKQVRLSLEQVNSGDRKIV